MRLIRIYIRVLSLLGTSARLAWVLAIANLALAATQFAEPILFGRVVDARRGVRLPPTSSSSSTLRGD